MMHSHEHDSTANDAILSRFVPAGLRISPGIARTARSRLGILTLILPALSVVGYSIAYFTELREVSIVDQQLRFALGLFGITLDLLMLGLVSWKKLQDRQVLELGYVYEVLRAASLSLAPLPDVGTAGISWVLILVVFFPTLLPPAGHLGRLALILAGLTQPMALSAVHLFVQPIPFYQLLYSIYSAITAIILGLVGADLIRRYQLDAPQELGSYQLVEKVGSGGMGEVWKAAHRFLARPAAIKLIPRDEKDSKSARKKLRRFRREAQVTANLTSPHTVAVYDYGMTESGVYYYVMEYLAGLDLQHLLKRERSLPPSRAVQFIAQACDSIGEAHQAGLIHRDLKP
ncbi:MAG: serine/threonine protein kinase, partial [Polyangiaceae bacterium]|nr:serine/threonine protein kinase [Polyangiaceae bacterium]